MQYKRMNLSNGKAKKKCRTIAVVMLLAFVFTMVTPISAFAAFPDVASDHWAIQQLDRVAARGIMGGYEDGTARPNNPVTQFEAIAMASRMMELKYDESTEKGTYLPFKYPDWDGAYGTAVAAYKAGLIDPNDFNHSGAASREWIAKLLIQALDAEDELEAAAGDAWAFTDGSSIDSKYANYVKLAYDKGLIGGYTDKTFKPKNTVTRAELAAFLCRVENQLKTTASNVVRGEITAISNVKVTINGSDGKTYDVYAVTTSTLYDKAGKKIGVIDLKVGDYVYVVYEDFKMTYLEMQTVKAEEVSASSEKTIRGAIRAIIAEKNTIVVLDENNELYTVVVDKNTKITEQGSKDKLTFEALQEKMKISMNVNEKNQIASEIVFEKNEHSALSGTIYSVDVYEKLIIMQEGSEPNKRLVSYEMANNIEVSISGMLTATASSLKEGDKATYTIVNGKMTAIAVGSRNATFGGSATVKSIDSTNRILTYVNPASEPKSAYYASGFAVTFKDGQTGTIADVQPGDSIDITVSNNQVTKLSVTNRAISEGLEVTFNSLDTSSNLITVTMADGQPKAYFLADNVQVLLSGSTSSLSMLKKGMPLALTLQNNKVIRIQANNMLENNASGEITSINTSNNTITVRTSSGISRTVSFTNDTYILKNGVTSTSIGTLSIGDRVLIDPVSSGKKITVMNSKSGVIRFATSTGIQFQNDELGNLYLVNTAYYCHESHSITKKSLSDLSTGGQSVTIYYTDQKNVYEIVIH